MSHHRVHLRVALSNSEAINFVVIAAESAFSAVMHVYCNQLTHQPSPRAALHILLPQVALSNSEAIDFVENVVKTEGIQCGFTRCPAFVLPSASAAVPGDSKDPRSSSRSDKADRQAGQTQGVFRKLAPLKPPSVCLSVCPRRCAAGNGLVRHPNHQQSYAACEVRTPPKACTQPQLRQQRHVLALRAMT